MDWTSQDVPHARGHQYWQQSMRLDEDISRMSLSFRFLFGVVRFLSTGVAPNTAAAQRMGSLGRLPIRSTLWDSCLMAERLYTRSDGIISLASALSRYSMSPSMRCFDSDYLLKENTGTSSLLGYQPRRGFCVSSSSIAVCMLFRQMR